MAIAIDFNLNLPATPQGVPEQLFGEFNRLYHALNNLAGYANSISGSIVTKFISILATEPLPIYRVVTANGKIADSANLAQAKKVIGITAATIATGFVGNVVNYGSITNPLWTWVVGDILYLNGTSLSTVAPATGFSQRIGVASGATTVIIVLSEPVLL